MALNMPSLIFGVLQMSLTGQLRGTAGRLRWAKRILLRGAADSLEWAVEVLPNA
jgi:hypothetical protein